MLSLTVSTGLDESDGDYSDGDLSLREALELSTDPSGDDLIRFDSGLTGATIRLDPLLGQLQVESNVTIEAPGVTIESVVSSGQRVLFVQAGVTASISGVTISRGWLEEGDGAGIYNAGALTLTNALVSGNSFGENNDAGRGIGIFNPAFPI